MRRTIVLVILLSLVTLGISAWDMEGQWVFEFDDETDNKLINAKASVSLRVSHRGNAFVGFDRGYDDRFFVGEILELDDVTIVFFRKEAPRNRGYYIGRRYGTVLKGQYVLENGNHGDWQLTRDR